MCIVLDLKKNILQHFAHIWAYMDTLRVRGLSQAPDSFELAA